MLMANETITLVHHEKTADGDRYLCTAAVGCSWFGKMGNTVSASGNNPSASYSVRIPEAVAPKELPVPGDFCVRGILGCCDGLKSLAGREYFVISFVGDNRRGRLPHVVVKSA